MESSRSWRATLASFDSRGEEKISAWMSHIGDPQTGGIPAKTRELVWIATSTAVRAHASIAAHVRGALEEGATEQEVYQAIVLGSASGGIPALAVGLAVLDEHFQRGE